MRIPRSIFGFVLIVWSCVCLAQNTARVPILPKQFAGWDLSGNVRKSTDPGLADPVNTALLKEYGFQDFESGTYVRDDGRKLTIKAARFEDASGAYGAFNYYRMPQMITEQIGDQGASLNERVLFLRGNTVIDAVFARLSAMSAAELRELSSALPLPAANQRGLPNLAGYLPKQSMVANSTRYILGTTGLEKTGFPLPADLIDFNAGAEVITAQYNTSGGESTLALISYPTPQIATAQLRNIEAKQNSSSVRFFDKRTGPIVVIAAGPIPESEAKSLLASVNYDADVTWNENTHFTKKDNIANLLVNIIFLCGIILGFMLVAGVAFGGIRIAAKRFFPDRVFDKANDMEFISLHLSDKAAPPDSKVSTSIKAV